MPLTSEAKKRLAETIRGTPQSPEKGLRSRLLAAIRDEADRRYRLSIPLTDAGLDEAHGKRRARIDSWIDERARAANPKNKAELAAVRERLRRQAEKEAAATLLNRLILLRQLEAHGLSKPAIVTGGWNSRGYREFREFAPTLCISGTTDATEGYQTLLRLAFDELAVDLPGLFGDVGLTSLFPIPAATLREVVERLDDPELSSAWTDDTTLGWVYQYWNDPDRDALDAKVLDGGKIDPHEIASKTQMFTERYMVDWLLQNSLGVTWLAMCRKKGWTADAEAIFPVLEARRADWRAKRESREVPVDALMPIDGELEDRWKYYVQQPIREDVIAHAPEAVRSIRLLDPACGSGHFLVIAFDLLAAMYREEAKHLGTTATDRQIAESILENNLHGVDIDPRAIQIAAAAIYLKAKTLSNEARPRRLNLVAPVLQLGNLPDSDPAVVQLRAELREDAGIPEELTTKLLKSLAGVDFLGSLLKVDAAVDEAIRGVELEFERTRGQGDLFGGFPSEQVKLSYGEARWTVLDRLERFLAKRSKSEDLGLRLDGEQLAAGVRFVRIAKDGTYDVVAANPPYQGIRKMSATLSASVKRASRHGKTELYAAFMLRSVELAKASGQVAIVALRNWMFANQLDDIRRSLADAAHLRVLADLHHGAFADGKDVSVAMFVCSPPALAEATSFIRPVSPGDITRDALQTTRNRAGLRCIAESFERRVAAFSSVPGAPLIYTWTPDFISEYARLQKLGDAAPVRYGAITGDNARFLRFVWELAPDQVLAVRTDLPLPPRSSWPRWAPYIKGAEGAVWFEPLIDVVQWSSGGLEMKVRNDFIFGSYTRLVQNEAWYFVPGIAFTTLGKQFAARAHRYRSIIGQMGSSVFPTDVPSTLTVMNSSRSRRVLEALNPGLHFDVGDVNRLPLFAISASEEIVAALDKAFADSEAGREGSVEFQSPRRGAIYWKTIQQWAQEAIDEGQYAPIPQPLDAEDVVDPRRELSFAIGVALGRFPPAAESIGGPLPAGVLFVATGGGDSIDEPASAIIRGAWEKHGDGVGEGDDLRTYLRKKFFDFHRKIYENRPIYFPVSSAKKNFVAFVSIHRWADDTLSLLLADRLIPARRTLEGELEDLRVARDSANNKNKAEKRYAEVQKLLDELNDFIAKVVEAAEKGPPPSDNATRPREVDARYSMDLDDGVMVNSAPLWRILEPQWKDPKKWWSQLANEKGPKGANFDWSHVALRYFPERVKAKCVVDPSIAVAHKCFWELHPANAYAWELRLQDEVRPDFTIDEPGSSEARRRFLTEHHHEAAELRTAEAKRRERKAARSDADDTPLLDTEEGDEEEEDTDG